MGFRVWIQARLPNTRDRHTQSLCQLGMIGMLK